MWPGGDASSGPPQAGRGPAGARPAARRRPGTGWYAVPAVLAAAAAALLLVIAGAHRSGADAAPGGRASGDARTGVTVDLAKGHGYFLYVRDNSTVPYVCHVRVRAAAGPVRLTRKNAWSAAGVPGYRYTASFEAPVTGRARLSCRGADGRLLVTPDGTAHFYLGLSALVSAVLAVLAVLSLGYLVVRRGRVGATLRAPADN